MPTINPKFEQLLPRLGDAERDLLAASLQAEGLRESILIWRETDELIDGHNRHELCETLGVTPRYAYMSFPHEDAVIEWIVSNQLGRRNLTPNEKAMYLGELYNAQKRQRGGDYTSQGELSETLSESSPVDTASAIGQRHGVSDRTVRNAAKFVDAVNQLDDDTRRDALKGKLTRGAVIQMVQPKPEPVAPIVSDTSAMRATDYVQATGKRLRAIIKAYSDEWQDFVTAMRDTHGITNLTMVFDSTVERHLGQLKTLTNRFSGVRVCAKCDGEGFVADKKCKPCQGVGVMHKTDITEAAREENR